MKVDIKQKSNAAVLSCALVIPQCASVLRVRRLFAIQEIAVCQIDSSEIFPIRRALAFLYGYPFLDELPCEFNLPCLDPICFPVDSFLLNIRVGAIDLNESSAPTRTQVQS